MHKQEIHSIECIEYCTKDQSNVEDVEDRSNTHKGCNAMYVEDVEDIKTSHNRCLLKYVEDVEDRSNTHKGCNAMFSKTLKMGKEHSHTFWLITSLILKIFNPKKVLES